MTESKVVLTYKRKRLSSRPALSHGIECHNSSSESVNSEVLITSVKREEESYIDCKSELQREISLDCCGRSKELQCKHCHSSYDVQSFDPSIKHTYHRRQLCDDCIKLKQQDALQIPKCSEENDVGLKNKSSVCGDAETGTRVPSPLITFSRRKRKKNVDVPDLDINAPQGSTNLKHSLDQGHFWKTNKEKILGDADFPVIPETKIESPDKCIEETHLITEQATENKPTLQTNNSMDYTEDIVVNFSDKDATRGSSCMIINKDEQQKPSICIVSTTEVSQTSPSDGAPRITGMDTRESCVMVDCNIALESSSNEQTVFTAYRDSFDSTSTNQLLCGSSPRGKVLDLLDERIGEASFTQPRHILENVYASGKHDNVLSMGVASNKNYLQLFIDDRTNDMLSMANSRQEVLSSMDPERRRRSSLGLESGKIHHKIARRFTSPWPNFGIKSGEPVQDIEIHSSTYDHPSSILRHRMLDNIITKTRALKGKRSGFMDTFNPHNTWLEEELDFLWVGVRRHGRGNWDAMLRDSRLHFSSWRSSRDLANRWEMEQSRLMNERPPQSKCFKPSDASSNHTMLSLGDVCIREECNNPKRVPLNVHNNPFQRAGINLHTVNCSNECCGNRKILGDDPSLVKGNLPHWLREAVNIPPPSHAVSYTGRSGWMEWINQPFSTATSKPHHGSPIRTTDGRARYPSVAKGYGGKKVEELIIIDSDASSEETISDDHSGVRPQV